MKNHQSQDDHAAEPDCGIGAEVAAPPGDMAKCSDELRARRRRAFGDGVLAAWTSVPAAVLFVTALGFGALARDAELSMEMAVFITIAIYALPAQVIFVDQLAREAALWTAAVAVTLTAIRLLPMAVTIAPYFRNDPGWFGWKLVAVHFVAITAWVEGHKRLPGVPDPLRLPFYNGLGTGFSVATLLGTVLGFILAGAVPPVVSAALLLLTPVYFLLSLFGAMARRSDGLAILVGGVLGPFCHLISPEFDLLIAGVIGGTIAWLVWRQERAAPETNRPGKDDRGA